MTFFKKHIWSITGIILGAIGGYLYYYFIGCSSGTCPIKSNPYISTLYGAIIGWLLFNIIETMYNNIKNKN